ncbi:hypothetical protein PMAYCL1PPCAC_03696, partial [Pristionchus mayeri]
FILLGTMEEDLLAVGEDLSLPVVSDKTLSVADFYEDEHTRLPLLSSLKFLLSGKAEEVAWVGALIFLNVQSTHRTATVSSFQLTCDWTDTSATTRRRTSSRSCQSCTRLERDGEHVLLLLHCQSRHLWLVKMGRGF